MILTYMKALPGFFLLKIIVKCYYKIDVVLSKKNNTGKIFREVL